MVAIIKSGVGGGNPRCFYVSGPWVGLGSNAPSLYRPASVLGCQCKVNGGKVYYGLGLPRLA